MRTLRRQDGGHGRVGGREHLQVFLTRHPQDRVPQTGKDKGDPHQGKRALPQAIFVHGIKGQDLLPRAHAAFALRIRAGEGHPLELIDGKGVEAPLDEGHVRTPLRPRGQALHVDEDPGEEQEDDGDRGGEGGGRGHVPGEGAHDQAQSNGANGFQKAEAREDQEGREAGLETDHPVGNTGEDEGP